MIQSPRNRLENKVVGSGRPLPTNSFQLSMSKPIFSGKTTLMNCYT